MVAINKDEEPKDKAKALLDKGYNEKLTQEELALALFYGLPHLQGLGSKLAEQYGKNVTFLPLHDELTEEIQEFWRSIAKQLIEHAKKWEGFKDEIGECVKFKLEERKEKKKE